MFQNAIIVLNRNNLGDPSSAMELHLYQFFYLMKFCAKNTQSNCAFEKVLMFHIKKKVFKAFIHYHIAACFQCVLLKGMPCENGNGYNSDHVSI